MSPPRTVRDWILIAGCALLLGGVLRWAAAIPLAVAGDRSIGDLAYTELAVIEASAGQRLVGQPTRFGQYQPGPAMFYLLAPLYWLTGGSRASLSLTPFLFAWGVLLLAGTTLLRWSEPVVIVPSAALFVAWYLGYLGPMGFFSYWNPFLLCAPAILFIPLAAGVLCGRRALIPWLLIVASFLVQTYAGTVPAVLAVIVAVASVLVFWTGPQRPQRRRRRWPVVGGLVLLAAMWWPPLREELRPGPGNLSRMVDWLGRPKAEQPSLAQAAAMIARQVSGPWLYLWAGTRALGPPAPREDRATHALGAMFVASVSAAGIVAWRRRQAHAAASCSLALVTVLTALVAAVVGPDLHPFMFMWLGGCAAIGWATALAVLLDRFVTRRPDRRLIVGGCAALIGVFLLHEAPHVPRLGDPRLDEVAAILSDRWHAGGTTEPLHLMTYDEAHWWVSGLQALLHRRRVPSALVNLPIAGEFWQPREAGTPIAFSTKESAPEPGLRLISCHRVVALSESSGRLCMFSRTAAAPQRSA